MRCPTFVVNAASRLARGWRPVASPDVALTDHLSTKCRYRVSFRVTAQERQSLDAAAQRCGLRLSQHARAVLLGAKPGRGRRRPAIEAALQPVSGVNTRDVRTKLAGLDLASMASVAEVRDNAARVPPAKVTPDLGRPQPR